MRVKIYLDEDVPVSLAQALQNRSVDVQTTQQAFNIGHTDLEQLIYSAKSHRVLFTHNIRDYVILHRNLLDQNKHHSGIIVSNQMPVGTLLKRTMKLWFSLDAADMTNRLEFLSNWK